MNILWSKIKTFKFNNIGFTGLLLILTLEACTQKEKFALVQSGSMTVGYSQALIYDSSQTYQEYGYQGYLPILVDIWFPLSVKKDTTIKFGDFQKRDLPDNLVAVHQELNKNLDESICRDALSEHIWTGEELNFGSLNKEAVLELIKSLDTKSLKAALPESMDFPVIVYHHGSRGQSYENHLMAEYFAERGYIFISANFHLPYSNTMFGLLPYRLEAMNRHNQSIAKTLINYARGLTRNSKLYFIGHSWGAQEGWCFLNEQGWADAFVSLETTIPFKSDPEVIREYWPQVYAKLVIQKNKFSIPTLVIEATEKDEAFPFFLNAANDRTWHVSSKKYFAHNSYTSVYLMRNFLGEVVQNSDSLELQEQVRLYHRHLSLIHDFLEDIAENKMWDYPEFTDDFYIHYPWTK
jgi:hypothetical protein